LLTVEKNTGIPANCNRGVRAAKGEWIKLIAGDDALFEDCITSNFEYLYDNPMVKVLVSKIAEFRDEFEKSNFIGYTSHLNHEFFGCNAAQQYDLLLRSNRIYTAPSLFIHNSIFDNILFDERFKLMEDYPFWLNLTKSGIKIYNLNILTVKYRQSNNSVYNKLTAKLVHDAYFLNEKFRKEYIYVHLPFLERFKEKFNYKVLSFLKYIDCLEKNSLNLVLFNLATRFFNPFAIIVSLKRRFKP
jgi:GT2 family glycosyltransferase